MKPFKAQFKVKYTDFKVENFIYSLYTRYWSFIIFVFLREMLEACILYFAIVLGSGLPTGIFFSKFSHIT